MTHDPGGRTRLRLPGDVRGWAEFSVCGRYRHALRRDWTVPGSGSGAAPRANLFVGLNPSVADAESSDPTCQRELTFARDWGFSRYLKGNILDWRATAPQDLPPDPQLARSQRNLPVLLDMAAEAEVIVMATGNVHPRFAGIARQTHQALRATGKPLQCLGLNRTGYAKHPLYLRRDAVLQRFPDQTRNG